MEKGQRENRSEESSDEELLNQENQKVDNKEKQLTCVICSKQYKNKITLKQHMQSHLGKQKCQYCEKSYIRLTDLRIHEKNVHEVRNENKHKLTSFTCATCGKHFGRKYHLTRHIASAHPHSTQRQSRSQFSCRHCACVFPNYNDLFQHVTENHPLNQQGGRMETEPRTLNNDEPVPNNGEKVLDRDDGKVQQRTETSENMHPSADESAIENAVVNRNIYPRSGEQYDALTFFGNIRNQVRTFLQSRVQALRGIKWNLCVQVEMQRDDGEDATVTAPYFRSRTYITLSLDDFNDHDINEAMQKMFASLEKFLREGSGWYVKKVLKLEIHTVVYRPVGGSTYIPLPKTLNLSHSLLNIQNQDNKCFLYCLLASLHPTLIQPQRAEHYYQYEQEVNMSGITYPVTLSQIRKVENQNENISINIFAYEDDSIVPLRITEKRNRLHHVNLLWLTCEETSHYCLITNLNRFLSRTNRHTGQLYFCPYCLHGFRKETSLQEHQQYCSRHEAQRIELPIPGENDILEFKDYEKTLKVPFVIYADFETINMKLHTCAPNHKHSAATPTTKLEVCGFGYKVVCEDDRYTKPSVIYRGEDASSKFIESLLQEQEEIQEILSTVEPMQITDEHDDLITNAVDCCICKKTFTAYDKIYGRIVRHHNHLTGEIIGPACNSCNLSCQQANFQFLPTSLETLVDNLAQDGLEAFQHVLSETVNNEDAGLLLRKGVYPYEYMDSFDKFDQSHLPPREQFYSTIKQEHISNEDYEHAQTVFKMFNMTSLGEYHDLYLKTDVLLLSDVFESFRTLCMKQYELDPCHFYTSPGLSWSSCLKMTGVKLELLTDIDKILMVEAGIRGGVSQISNRYKKANNPYLQDYDPSQPTSFLQYLDANNLYGWSMVQPLPVSDFAFMEERDIQLFDVMSVPEQGETGYILEVSLGYPKNLHDEHNCLPLAPERKIIPNEVLSPYAQHLLRKLHGLSEDDPLPNRGKVEKLLTTLEDKDHYVLHYRNLQLYLRLGMKIKTIHRILKFKQEAWMKPYIDHNTEMRKKAKSTFEKNFYKLMNVSVFGKTMENVRRHKNIELVHTEKRLKKVTAKPTYKHTTIFNEDLVAVELFKTKVNLFKPIYCDLSKCLMYDFWYNYIKQKYKDSAQLQMTDTDSVLYSCETEDIYEDMKASLDYFDTSDYPKEHFLHSDQNKKVLGKMKDETNGMPISEFIGLRSKMYSFLCNGKEEKRAKGVAKVTVKKDLKHDCYKNTLFDETNTVSTMHSLRSHRHELFGETTQKISLSAVDDKRFLMDAVRSYAYGHFKIASDSNNRVDENDPQIVSIMSVEDFLANQGASWKKLDEEAFMIGDFKITPCVKQ
ncbi:uncharacterized protein LOC123531918 [Mercenaria mercenaria]|uniref:uncharacterized protein LOC123531918 n=1 Tax=Mercenaria mercenaria TaxID=6596 RepID=UPI00234F4B50|nr:uncharacterized protein LOC123531918 [Mercenaria mercenaria]